MSRNAGTIFTAGAIPMQVRQAEAARKAALYNYELSIQRAFSDVDNTLEARKKYVNIYKAMGGGWIIEAEKMILPPLGIDKPFSCSTPFFPHLFNWYKDSKHEK